MNKESKNKLINVILVIIFTFLLVMFISTIPVVYQQRMQIIELESENTDLKQEISVLKQSIQALEVDLEEMTNQLFNSDLEDNGLDE